MHSPNDSFPEEDDGLVYPPVGAWALEKHKKIGYYASIFSDSMRKKWDCRLYIDLFAGAGAAKIKGTERRIKGSPLMVLGLDIPFDKHIFCEENPELCEALKERIARRHPEADTVILNVNCNTQIDKIINSLPAFNKSYKGIAFCFVDPFNASNLSFGTLRRLSAAVYVDFAVLLPSHMDIHRNQINYTKEECRILDDLLGESNWRQDWVSGASRIKDFGLFIADRFGQQMKTNGYLYDGTEDYVTVRMGGEDSGLFLYHLCFFSKHPLGKQFWRESRTRTTKQMSLF
jgi:three-Cys-motif partner protein